MITGWSYYSQEGSRTTCSVEWEDPSFNVQSYNVTILVTVYVIPLTLIVYFNMGIVLTVII